MRQVKLLPLLLPLLLPFVASSTPVVYSIGATMYINAPDFVNISPPNGVAGFSGDSVARCGFFVNIKPCGVSLTYVPNISNPASTLLRVTGGTFTDIFFLIFEYYFVNADLARVGSYQQAFTDGTPRSGQFSTLDVSLAPEPGSLGLLLVSALAGFSYWKFARIRSQ